MVKIPSSDVLLSHVMAVLNNPNAPSSDSRTEWTHYLARQLANLCPADGVSVYGRQWKAEDRGEYLCDQAWGQIASNQSLDSYRGLILAMECEWDGTEDANLDDFCKVLDSCADRRLFVGNLWSTRSWQNRQAFVQRLANMVSRHRHLPTGSEIVVVLCEKGGNESIDSWILRPGQDPEHRGD